MVRRIPSCLGLFVVASSTLFIATLDARAKECVRYSSTPLGEQVDLLADPMPTFESGQVLTSFGAFAVKLRPAKQVVYPYKSSNDHDAGMGAVLAIEYVPAGTMRISLSAPARLSAIQDNVTLPQAEVEQTEGCPGELQAIDIRSAGGPLILQLSGSTQPRLKMLVAPAPPGLADGGQRELLRARR